MGAGHERAGQLRPLAFAEFRLVHDLEADFARLVERQLEDAKDIAAAHARRHETAVDFDTFRSLLAPGRAP